MHSAAVGGTLCDARVVYSATDGVGRVWHI